MSERLLNFVTLQSLSVSRVKGSHAALGRVLKLFQSPPLHLSKHLQTLIFLARAAEVRITRGGDVQPRDLRRVRLHCEQSSLTFTNDCATTTTRSEALQQLCGKKKNTHWSGFLLTSSPLSHIYPTASSFVSLLQQVPTPPLFLPHLTLLPYK